MTNNGTRVAMKKLGGDNAGHGLCAETQGRKIIASLVNDAVEEAFGFSRPARAAAEPPRTPAQQKSVPE